MAQETLNIGDTGQQLVDKWDNNFTELYGLHVEDERLKEWAGGKDVEFLVRTVDSEGLTTSSTLKWPDASGGTYTATDYNATHELYDGWTMTHTVSGKTVTQAAVTRNGDGIGAITNKPELTVA